MSAATERTARVTTPVPKYAPCRRFKSCLARIPYTIVMTIFTKSIGDVTFVVLCGKHDGFTVCLPASMAGDVKERYVAELRGFYG